MKVVAVLGGLGSQMIKYAFYLALKQYSKQECFIDTSFFNKKRAGSWNGYELKDIFNVSAPDINELIDDKWLDDGDWYPARAMRYMAESGPIIYYDRGLPIMYDKGYPQYGLLQRMILRYRKQRKKRLERSRTGFDDYPEDYAKNTVNAYFDEFDHRSDKYFRDCKEIIRRNFKFPEFVDGKNCFYARQMRNEVSIAIHVRRSDHMYDNHALFEREYFAKSVDLIKRLTSNDNRKWYVFSDDISWCMKNKKSLGFSVDDVIVPVDWNRDNESYKDMQLMTYCKHNIIPISSFSWWGYYLGKDTEGKIVCAPNDYWTEVEYHF